MDNLTHSLVGLAAARAGLGRTSSLAALTCVAAANLPDADIVALFGGPSYYLEHHRGITHSIVGAVALGLLLPVLLVAGERLWARVRSRPPRASFRALLLCSLLLTASHPLLDWTNSYGLRPLLPWDAGWYYGDLVFILDPYLWLVLGGAAFLASEPRPARDALWSALALLLSVALLYLPARAGMPIPLAGFVIWFAGLAAIVLARVKGAGVRWGAATPTAALALVIAYWGVLAIVQSRAAAAAHATAERLANPGGERVLRAAAMPVLADPTAWLCAAETDAATWRYRISLGVDQAVRAPRDVLRVEKPAGAEADLIAGAGRDERVRVLLDFARFPVARLGRNCAGELVAQFADLRFTTPGGERRAGNFSVEVPLAGAP